jgi:hypothetical protein
MATMLYTSGAVRQAIIELFSSPTGRRVAVAAFVGEGADAYLPSPEGLELFCWPMPGATNPNTLRALMKRGVGVRFVDSLHMKFYWAEGRGAVLTSAKLSTNALGAGNLKEIGVFLKPGEVDIDAVLGSLNSRPVSAKEMRALDRKHKLYLARNRAAQKTDAGSLSFGDWYAAPMRPRWKWACWDKTMKRAATTRAIVRKVYGTNEADRCFSDQRKDWKQGDWALLFRMKDGQFPLWVFVDLVVRIPRSDKCYDPEYPWEMVQVWSARRYPPPPFRLDQRFQRALNAAVREIGPERVRGYDQKSTRPPKRLLDAIYGHYA